MFFRGGWAGKGGGSTAGWVGAWGCDGAKDWSPYRLAPPDLPPYKAAGANRGRILLHLPTYRPHLCPPIPCRPTPTYPLPPACRLPRAGPADLPYGATPAASGTPPAGARRSGAPSVLPYGRPTSASGGRPLGQIRGTYAYLPTYLPTYLPYRPYPTGSQADFVGQLAHPTYLPPIPSSSRPLGQIRGADAYPHLPYRPYPTGSQADFVGQLALPTYLPPIPYPPTYLPTVPYGLAGRLRRPARPPYPTYHLRTVPYEDGLPGYFGYGAGVVGRGGRTTPASWSEPCRAGGAVGRA